MDIAFQLLAGWFVADLAGGLYHAFIDHVASPTGIWGNIVRDFREHHNDRLSMEKYSRVPSMLLSGMAGLPFILLWSLGWFSAAFAWTVFVGLCLTQHAHRWSHNPAVAPRWALTAQQVGLLISPETHERHHGDFERDYSVFNGWANGLMNLLLPKPTHA